MACQIFGTVLMILQHGTPNIGPKCNVAPVVKILGVLRLPPGGSLGMGKRGTVPKIWCAVLIFSTCKLVLEIPFRHLE